MQKSTHRKHFLFSLQKGDIVLLEENDPYYIYKNGQVVGPVMDTRQFLRDNDVFSKIGGLLFGRSNILNMQDYDTDDVFVPAENIYEKKYLKKCIQSVVPEGIPVLANVACSHTHPMVTLPLGKQVTLDATRQTLTVHFDSAS